MGTPILDPWVLRCGCADFNSVLLGVGKGNAYFRVINVGDYPPYGKDPGGIPPQGGDMDHG